MPLSLSSPRSKINCCWGLICGVLATQPKEQPSACVAIVPVQTGTNGRIFAARKLNVGTKTAIFARPKYGNFCCGGYLFFLTSPLDDTTYMYQPSSPVYRRWQPQTVINVLTFIHSGNNVFFLRKRIRKIEKRWNSLHERSSGRKKRNDCTPSRLTNPTSTLKVCTSYWIFFPIWPA